MMLLWLMALGIITMTVYYSKSQRPATMAPSFNDLSSLSQLIAHRLSEILKPVTDIPQSEKVIFDPSTSNYLIEYERSDGTKDYWVFEPATKVDVQVEVDVRRDPSSGLYIYEYKVISAPTSAQKIEMFGVSYSGDIERIESPEGWGSFNSFGGRSVVMWGGHADEFLINPGGSLGGFRIFSRSPPKERDCYAQGYVEIPKFAPGEAPEDIRPKFFGNCVTGTTLGP